MKSQRLTELRKQIWDDKYMLTQGDTILQGQLDQFAELIINDVLDTFVRAERVATSLGQTEKVTSIQEITAKFKEKYDIVVEKLDATN
jgi:hypothetical protein